MTGMELLWEETGQLNRSSDCNGPIVGRDLELEWCVHAVLLPYLCSFTVIQYLVFGGVVLVI